MGRLVPGYGPWMVSGVHTVKGAAHLIDIMGHDWITEHSPRRAWQSRRIKKPRRAIKYIAGVIPHKQRTRQIHVYNVKYNVYHVYGVLVRYVPFIRHFGAFCVLFTNSFSYVSV